MRKKIIGITLILGLILMGSMSGLHFNVINTIPGTVKKVRTANIDDYGKAVLFEDITYKTFGVAKAEKKFGFLYRYDGGTYGYGIEEGKPFQASGIADQNGFIVAIKIAKDSNIKYIALGNHMDGIMPSDTYELSLDDVKANSDDYQLKEVTDNYVLFVLEEYSENSYTIRAFDNDGNLTADQLFGRDARYIDWGKSE